MFFVDHKRSRQSPIRHNQGGSVRFAQEGWIRTLYLKILFSHIVPAVVIVPMVLRTIYLAFKERSDKHVGIARWTFPIWMYG